MVLKSRLVLLLLVLGGEIPSWSMAFTALSSSSSSSSSRLVRSVPSPPMLVPMATSSSQDLDPQQEPEPVARPTPTTTKNPTPVLLSAWKDWTQSLSSSSSSSSVSLPSILATLCLAATLSLTLLSPDPAWAAVSGGRMGGSFGSAAPRMSRPVPRASSYYGGGSRGYYGGGGYRSGGVTIAPIVPLVPGPSYYGPPPIVGGPGVLAAPYVRGPSFFDLLFFGGFAFVALSAVTSSFGNAMSRTVDETGGFWTSSSSDTLSSALGPGVTVAQLSVALEIPNRDDRNSLLSILDRLAQTARTDSRVGLQNLTSQVALELLRRKASIVSAHAESQHFSSIEPAQRNFNVRAVQERGKFEHETVSQYGGVNYSGDASLTTSSSSSSSSTSRGDKATVAVVTLVIALDGDSTSLPTIRSMADVEQALQRIAANVKVADCLQSAEILWTPQDRSETLTLRDVIADYPKLRTV